MTPIDFQITVSRVMNLMNLSRQSGRIFIGNTVEGDDGEGHIGGIYDIPDTDFTANELESLYLVLDEDYANMLPITSNGGTGADSYIKIAGEPDLSAASNNYIIRSNRIINQDQFDEAVVDASGWVASNLRVPYSSMLRYIEGEILDRHVNQTGSHDYNLGIETADEDTLIVYKNLRGRLKDRFFKNSSGEYDNITLLSEDDWDYDDDTNTLTIADGALVVGDVLYADYTHNLSSPPAILQRIVSNKVAGDLLHRIFQSKADQMYEYADYLLAQVDKDMELINKQGISDFDDLSLYEETEIDQTQSTQYMEFTIYRR